MKRYCYICGYETTDSKIIDCPECLCDNTIVSSKDEEELIKLSDDRELTSAMLQLKEKDIIEYKMRLQKLKTIKLQQKQVKTQQKVQNTPHCPTCGSTNIQKISDTKRWLTTGLFGLASSDVGKTMVCKKCGYKF